MAKSKSVPAAVRNQIAATKGYQGVVGTYQGFDAHGDAIPQWAWIERYHNGQWVILHPTKVFLPAVIKSFQYSFSDRLLEAKAIALSSSVTAPE